LSCATTSGVVCACDAGLANCIAVSAVVASRRRRSRVMMVGIPEKSATSSGDQRIRLGRIVAASESGLVFILATQGRNASLFIAHSGDRFQPSFHIVPRGISAMSGFRSGAEPGRSAIPSPVGEGAGGPCGPRTGNSSGLLPGSSSGRGGSPGSRCGGGTSGRGLPGGLSCGGSDGCPGLIGGSSCGSIGVSLIQNNDAARPMFL
jgi:hypothetical protein